MPLTAYYSSQVTCFLPSPSFESTVSDRKNKNQEKLSFFPSLLDCCLNSETLFNKEEEEKGVVAGCCLQARVSMLGVNITHPPPPPPSIDRYKMHNSPVTHFNLSSSDSLRKCSKTSGRQCSSGNRFDHSHECLTDNNDSAALEASTSSGEVKRLGAFLKIDIINPHRMQLQREVEKLQQELEDEMELRSVLENSVEPSALASSDLSCIPEHAKELLSSIAILEITVSDLEEEMTSLQCQLSQERNERKLAEYHLKRTSSHSPFLRSPDNMKRLVSSRCLEPSTGLSHNSRGLSRTRRTDEPSENSCSTSYINTTNQAIEDSVPSFRDETVSAKNPQRATPKEGVGVAGIWGQPNKLSEEMVRCMKNIFISLADSSTLSSKLRAVKMNCPPFSPQSECSTNLPWVHNQQVDTESVGELFGAKNAFDPYKVRGKLSWADIGIYGSAIEVSWMSVGKKQLEYAAGALRRFRLLVGQLAEVNPIHLSDNEKLAFWINIYNALIMHAYLAYGVPKSDLKLFSLMQKAAYTVGDHSFSAAAIEYVILKMQPPVHRPQTALVLGLHKLKVPAAQQNYSIDVHEPLVAFALSCGMYSSPAVRVYSVQNVREELQHARRDFVRASVGVNRRGKLLMPRMLCEFASNLADDLNLGVWVSQYLPPRQAAVVEQCVSKRRQSFLGRSSTVVVPFDSRFRYLFLPVVPDSKLCSSTLR